MILILTIMLLFITNSLYMELSELYIMIGSISLISIVYNLFKNTKWKFDQVIISSIIIGFLLSYGFSFIDLGLDHYKYIQGVPDGSFLTLGETISEFSDDLFVLIPIVMSSVILITLAVTAAYSKFIKKEA